MNWCDETLGFGREPQPTEDEVQARLKALSPEELVRAWREMNTAGFKGRTDGTYAVSMHFDGLAHNEPERTIAFIEALLANEPDDRLVALVAQGKLLGQLLHFHGVGVARSLQELAMRAPRLRWLMGGVALSIEAGMVENPDAQRRLLNIADRAAFEAWQKPYRPHEQPDFTALTPAELAPLWVEINSRSNLDKEKDVDWGTMSDFQYELVNAEPLKALELVKAILEIEDNPHLLGLLAAGMLEDLIPAEDGPVVDAVVAEAERNRKFRHLLGGVWFSGMSDEVVARLEEAREGVAW